MCIKEQLSNNNTTLDTKNTTRNRRKLNMKIQENTILCRDIEFLLF